MDVAVVSETATGFPGGFGGFDGALCLLRAVDGGAGRLSGTGAGLLCQRLWAVVPGLCAAIKGRSAAHPTDGAALRYRKAPEKRRQAFPPARPVLGNYLMSICRACGNASVFFGKVSFSTPSSYLAAMRSASTPLRSNSRLYTP